MTLWAFGGGTQSAAIAALVCNGKLSPPDFAYISDTGREGSETWTYLDEVITPRLSDVGVNIHRIPHSYSTVDLWSGADGNSIVMPMFSTQNGRGMASKFCSTEWKKRPGERYLREHGITEGDLWIGFSADEMQRCRTRESGGKYPHVYPLIDLRMSRNDCLAYLNRAGWPEPPRSSCWMCPYKTQKEWASLPAGDFAKAVALEKEIQLRDTDLWFHRSCEPLDAVRFDDQPDLFAEECDSGMCFT